METAQWEHINVPEFVAKLNFYLNSLQYIFILLYTFTRYAWIMYYVIHDFIDLYFMVTFIF